MSDANLDYDPILAATVAALSEVRPASEALDHIANALSGRDARRANELGGRLAQERIFDRRDLSIFDPVIKATERAVSEGRVRKVDYKEFGEPDVYWGLSESALRLDKHKRTLVRLRDALERLHILRRAEQRTLQFRTEDSA